MNIKTTCKEAVLFLTALLLIASPATAENFVGKTLVTGIDDLHALRASKHTPARGQQSISPLRFSAEIAGIGLSEFIFTTKVVPAWKAYLVDSSGRRQDTKLKETVLLQGRVRVPGHRADPIPATGAFINGSFRAAFYLAEDKMQYTVRIAEQRAPTTVALVDRVRIPERAMACGVSGKSRSSASSAVVAAPATLRVIELATDADSAWFNRYGSDSNAEIASIVNDAVTIYENQLNLTIEIVEQNVFTTTATSPYTQIDSELLLEQFRDYTNAQSHLAQADVYHLFTAKDLGGSSDPTIGIAYLGVICEDPENSYSLTEDSPGIHAVVFAHEIGHNLNADHDESFPISIMFPAITDPPATNFSNFSISEISSFVNTKGSCLSEGSSSPTATPTAGPSRTPTAGPSPTPTTPSGGGGGGGGDDGTGPTPTEVTLSATISGMTLTANITVGAADENCTLKLRGSPTQGGVLTGKVVYETPADFTSLTLIAEISQKISRQSSNRIYLVADLYCPTASGASYSQLIKPRRSAASRLTPQKWLGALKRALAD